MSTMRRGPLGRVYAVYLCDSQPLVDGSDVTFHRALGTGLGNDIKLFEMLFQWV